MLALKVLVAATLISVLFYRLDWAVCSQLVRRIDLQQALFAPVLLFIGIGFGAYRWKRMLFACGQTASLGQTMGWYLKSMFFGVFLPGVVGADLVRVSLAAKVARIRFVDAAVTAMAERVVGLLAILILTAIGAELCRGDSSAVAQTLNWLPSLTIAVLSIVVAAVLFQWRYGAAIASNPILGRGRFVAFSTVLISIGRISSLELLMSLALSLLY
ncbi:MAG: flippase-like domain-containing protein, partial [Planctomycetaceae bacterium]|nr:flippase-like domain-containing protein [Planctomycetaceae bacterium]